VRSSPKVRAPGRFAFIWAPSYPLGAAAGGGIAENEKGLLEVIRQDEGELKHLREELRATRERAGKVEEMADIIGRCSLGEAYEKTDRDLFDEHARAVAAYLKGEGK